MEPTQPGPSQGSDPTPPGAPASWAPPSPPAAAASGFNLNDFISFKYLITPGFITVIYVIGAIGITLAALASAAVPRGGGVVGGLLIFAAGQFFLRVYLEFVMVLFRINDSLSNIERRGRGM